MTAATLTSLAAAFVASASTCHTPKQFRKLLDTLQTVLPYRGLLCGWGNLSTSTVAFFINHGYPTQFLRWYLTRGMPWKDPAFLEWLRTGQPLVWVDYTSAELLEHAMMFHVQYAIIGGLARGDTWAGFALNMETEESARKHLEQFQMIIRALSEALMRAYPRPLLSERQTSILERRAMGEITKQIAAGEGISERTVRKHLQHIKTKLYTDDLVNAVVIADKIGMIGRTSKGWLWQ